MNVKLFEKVLTVSVDKFELFYCVVKMKFSD